MGKTFAGFAIALQLVCVGASLGENGSFGSSGNEQLFAVNITDPERVIAVGEHSTVLRTTDGGATWTVQSEVAGDVRLLGSSFVDGDVGTVVGESGTILRTTDGGESWSLQDGGTTVRLNDVSFADADNGFVVGNEGTLLHTVDGGATWLRQDVAFGGSLIAVKTLDAGTAFVSGNEIILRTDDGGSTWSNSLVYPHAYFGTMSFVDANTGWVAGTYGLNPILLHTSDGGQTWSEQRFTTSRGFLPRIAFADESRGFILATNTRTMFRTTDGGLSWDREDVLPSGALYGLSLLDSNIGVAVGLNGVVVRTEDGGSTWVLQHGSL